MKYKFYGTAAAEAIPALWCKCKVCKAARTKGGRNIMSRSQQTINDELLIDFPADTYMHVVQGLPLCDIHTLIITHHHSDHLYPFDIAMRKTGFAHFGEEEEVLDIYATKAAAAYIKEVFAYAGVDKDHKRFCLHEIKEFQSFTTKEGYEIIPLAADHTSAKDPVIFLVQRDGKCVLHGNDTGYFTEETWKYLEQHPVHIDFAEFDCTSIGCNEFGDKSSAHMNLPTAVHVRSKLWEMGLIDDASICVINHFSHNGGFTYDEICVKAAENGFLSSYDGMEVEF